MSLGCRTLVAVVFVGFVLAACGGSVRGPGGQAGQEPHAIAESPEMRALFSRLSPPRVTPRSGHDDAPRLVLRDGPAVPEVQTTPLSSAIGARSQTPQAPGPVAPLKVQSYAPTDEDELTGAIRITFDQPMVAVAQLRELHVPTAPLEITPQVPGIVRWLGTHTLAFEPVAGRLPLATDYTVKVPAGTRSVLGGVLPRELTFSIQTPAPVIVEHLPRDGAGAVAREPWLMLRFNQTVEPRAVAASLRVRVEGADTADESPWVLVTPEEFAAERSEHPEIGVDLDDRTVVLKSTARLSASASYRVVLPVGFIGAEGPKPTPEDYSFGFRTIEPLRVVGVRCGRDRCVPGTPVLLQLNHPIAIDDAALKASLKVQPTPADFAPRVSGNTVQLQGAFAPRTNYRVQLAAGLRDVHGQVLEHDFSASVRVGDALPAFTLGFGQMATLERDGPRDISVRSINVPALDARVTRVDRDAVFGVLSALQRGAYGDVGSTDPFALIVPRRGSVRTIRSRAAANQATTIDVSIAEGVGIGDTGYALLELRARGEGLNAQSRSLVQVTNLNAIALANGDGVLVRVLRLSDARPVAGATVELVDWWGGEAAAKATTDAEGVARVPTIGAARRMMRVTHGDDQALVELPWIGPRHPETVGTIFTDRDPYRPGETVHFKLLVRDRGQAASGSTRTLPAGTSVRCRVHDGNYQEHSNIHGVLSDYGTFAHDLSLPVGAALGTWHLRCDVGEPNTSREHIENEWPTAGVSGSFHVYEYRAPEIEVDTHAPDGSFIHGDRAVFNVESRYLFGAAAASLPLHYTVVATPEHFAPSGHPGFHFGERPLHWRAPPASPKRGVAANASSRAVLGADGKAALPVVLEPGAHTGPLRFQLEAAVTDLSRQQVASRASVIAHPSEVYVGVRVARPFVADDEPIAASSVVVNVAGGVVAGRGVLMRLLREVGTPSWHPSRGLAYRVDEKRVGTCTTASTNSSTALSTGSPAQDSTRCNFPAQPPGRYTIEATTTDTRGREAKTRVGLWVYGAGIRPWFSDTPSVEISADKPSYAVGETAKLLVRAPIASGRGLLTLERRGIVESHAIELNGSIQSIEVPITDAHVPNLTVRLSLVRGRLSDADVATLLAGLGAEAKRAAAADIGRPLRVSGAIELQVDRDSKRLAVTIAAEHATRQPGQDSNVMVEVQEPNGSAADAEVTIMAVDEAVLSLLEHQTPDPLPTFLPPVRASTAHASVADNLIRRLSVATSTGRARPVTEVRTGGDRSGGGLVDYLGGIEMGGLESPLSADGAPTNGRGSSAPTTRRALFATTAYYLASARTDNGRVNVHFKVPDNLTRFRLMAIAVGRDDHAGSGQGQVTVRKPLLLRPALPRVASFGDRFDAVVIAHNETGIAADVTIGIRAAGLSVDGPAIRREHLAAGEARDVAFSVVADHVGGAARVQFAAMTESASDAVEVDVPLIEPATSEAFATYGSLTGGAVRYPLRVPTDAIGRFGGLELSLSSTALTTLTDGVAYLLEYPYQSAEQISSRLMGAASLSAALAGRDDARAAAMRQAATESVVQLEGLRRADGSFSTWRGDGGDGSFHLATAAWAALALHEARLAQITVSPRLLKGVRGFLEHRLQYPQRNRTDSMSDQALGAYALSQLGAEVPAAALDRLWQQRQTLPLVARAWLASTLHQSHPRRSQELLRQIRNAAVETAAGAHFALTESEDARYLWHSEHLANAIVLRTLLQIAPADPLIEKAARGLNAARRNGRWRTTHENGWALSALSRYYRIAEGQTPKLVARAWLGDALLSEHELRGRKTPTRSATLPMSTLQALGSGDLTIGHEGEGRLYYRAGLRYALRSLSLDAAEQGFAVTRTFESIDEGDDVRRDHDGTWHVKAASTVRVRLTVVVPDTRYDVALDDPLAAGLEPLNLGFATTARQTYADAVRDARGPQAMLWGRRCWTPWAFQHREMRDDRVTAFSRVVDAGVYELVYLARATTPGRFVVAPTKVQEMYAPETFARSNSDILVVER